MGDKLTEFRQKMDNKDNRRLARFAMTKNQGFWRNYTALPYYMKYKKYEDGRIIDQISDKYAQLLSDDFHQKILMI